MDPLKAPGSDGVPAVFCQKHRETVGPYIMKAVQHFFENRFLLHEWNTTLICLIPKVIKPEEASQFRPISLCNVIYKIIAKVLVNRMKPIL